MGSRVDVRAVVQPLIPSNVPPQAVEQSPTQIPEVGRTPVVVPQRFEELKVVGELLMLLGQLRHDRVVEQRREASLQAALEQAVKHDGRAEIQDPVDIVRCEVGSAEKQVPVKSGEICPGKPGIIRPHDRHGRWMKRAPV